MVRPTTAFNRIDLLGEYDSRGLPIVVLRVLDARHVQGHFKFFVLRDSKLEFLIFEFLHEITPRPSFWVVSR